MKSERIVFALGVFLLIASFVFHLGMNKEPYIDIMSAIGAGFIIAHILGEN